MKEIKFRQPVFLHNEFIKWHYWGFISEGMFVGPLPPLSNAREQSQRFTGLQDENKVDIYEGDLLKDRNGNIRDVHWTDIYAGFCSKCLSNGGHHPEFDDERINHAWIQIKGAKVFSNIFENKEPIKCN